MTPWFNVYLDDPDFVAQVCALELWIAAGGLEQIGGTQRLPTPSAPLRGEGAA